MDAKAMPSGPELSEVERLRAAISVAYSSLSWCAGHLETCQGGPPSPPPVHVQEALNLLAKVIAS